MLRFSKGLISIILFCTIILLGFINTSSADIEIEALEVYPILSSTDTFYMLVYVQTSEPYHGIDYYLDDTWIERAYGNGERKIDYLWYDESDFGGKLTGTKHTLKLSVMSLTISTRSKIEKGCLMEGIVPLHYITFREKNDAFINNQSGHAAMLRSDSEC